MSLIERYRALYEYEKACNIKMLAMLESVPDANRADPRFQQAVGLAGHLAACRENWLDNMQGDGMNQTDWFPNAMELSDLPSRFAALESSWTDYLAALDDVRLAQNFEFPVDGGYRYALGVETQTVQLFAHAPYHRGQIALLVDQLGGEATDTDYVYWITGEW